MKTLVLHIGTWKTGTTSIQETLFHSRDELHKNNITYPSYDSNHMFMVAKFHHDLSKFKVMNQFYERNIDINDWIERRVVSFVHEIDDFKKTVLSSEHFFQLKREGICRLCNFLSSYFRKIKIFLYVRHPVNHVSSAICEIVRQGEGTLEKLYENPPFQFYEILDVWGEIFGKENIMIRDFHPGKWRNRSLIDDFMFHAINNENIRLTTTFKNESLSNRATLILNELNIQGKVQRGHIAQLSRLVSDPYVIPSDVLDRHANKVEKILRYLNDSFNFTPSYKGIIAN